MVPDPYAGDTFVFPPTPCTDERKIWFRRTNEIFGFLMITRLALRESKSKFEQHLSHQKLGAGTPFKLPSSDGQSIILPLGGLLLNDGVNILCRQIFVMFYGSLETYLYNLFERSFPMVGITKDILDQSISILMGGTWDGKFCKMHHIFGVDYKANDLINHFMGFEMDIEGEVFKNPLSFLDKLAKVRHQIIHASSILEHGKLIIIPEHIFHAFYAFYMVLTDYVDQLFARRFGYARVVIDPAKA
jgi:hypothetical protein